MSHNVYKVIYTLAMQDPDMPAPRYHHLIFVETKADGSGFAHQVLGDIASGMFYDAGRSERPEDAEMFIKKELLGTIDAADYPLRFDQVLVAQPPPPKQKHFNTKTMRTEQIKPDGTFYEPGEARPPMIKCTEWTVNQAIPALYAAGIVQK